MMPQRIQRKRTKGFRLPEGTIYVGRPTVWGNAFMLSSPSDRDDAIAWYRHYIEHVLEHIPGFLEPLRGKDLACWCPLDQACHADVLLELVRERYGDAE